MEDRTNIYNKVVSLIAQQLNVSPDKINEQSTMESLGADSLDRFEIVMKFEEEFSIAISDEDAEKLETVKQVVDYIAQAR